MNSELDTAVGAAYLAGQLLREAFHQDHQITMKGIINPVTEMDEKCEQTIAEYLQREYPQYGILGEEGLNFGSSETGRWIIDPLDGTSNYAHGYPVFAVSIALEVKSKIVVGVVYNPILDEMFAAQKSKGATLNKQRIQVSSTRNLGDSLLASGFPYGAWMLENDNGVEWHRFLKRVRSLRCDGSAALDLVHVACGRLDGYWELDVESWDISAGALIVEEAGGIVSLVNGQPFNPFQRTCVASNGLIHTSILSSLV